MGRANECSEQSVPIEIALEKADAASAGQASPVPIAAGLRIDGKTQEAAVGQNVRARVGVAEETVERFVVGELTSSCELQACQRDMRPVQIDRQNLCRVGGQVR